MRLALVFGSVFLFVVLIPTSSAHIRDPGDCDPYGYCELFYGNTTTSGGDVKDPVTIVYYRYGRWENVRTIFENELGWLSGEGSDQYNYRLIGTMGSAYWSNSKQTIQRAQFSSGARWHARAFEGHSHGDNAENWSVATPHHDPWDHDDGPDKSWQESEDYVRASAINYQRVNEENWTYLPRAHGGFQNFDYNGWPARIYAGVVGGCGSISCY